MDSGPPTLTSAMDCDMHDSVDRSIPMMSRVSTGHEDLVVDDMDMQEQDVDFAGKLNFQLRLFHICICSL